MEKYRIIKKIDNIYCVIDYTTDNLDDIFEGSVSDCYAFLKFKEKGLL